MKNSMLLCAGLLGILIASNPVSVLADGHNLLKDSSFEQQLPRDQGGWGPFEISIFSKNQARSGEKSMFNGGFSRSVPYQPFFVGNVSGSYQELPASAGSRWRLTGHGMVENKLEGTPAFGIVQVTFFDADGNDLGTVETVDGTSKAKTSNRINRQTPVGEWTFLDTGVATAPEGTATIQAFTLFVDFSGADTTQGVYFDDLVLCAVDKGSVSCGEE